MLLSSVKHYLNRCLFGCTIDDIAFFKDKSRSELVSHLIEDEPKPQPPINYYQSKLNDPNGIKEGETWIEANYGSGEANFRRRQSLRYWWFQNMMFQNRTLKEKMILFWHNHFATQLEIYDVAKAAYKYQDVIRNNAFGNFKTFVKEITLDPAMLEYLNGNVNSREAPDENYARELQELFTIGKGRNQRYTEKDVREAARVLTGHKYDWDSQTYFYEDWDHDKEDKSFSAFYNNAVIKGSNGEQELDELLEIIFDKEEVSEFIVTKLFRFFVYAQIDQNTLNNFIKPVAKVFRENNYEIKPLLRAFFDNDHFENEAFHGALIVSPIELVVKTFRIFQPKLPALEDSIYLNYSMTGVLMRFAESMQQYICDPPSVSGWPAYHQAPLYHQIWINADTYKKRGFFVAALFYNEIKREDEVLEANLIEFTKKFSEPENPNKLIQDSIDLLFSFDVNENTKSAIKKEILLSGQQNDFYWTQLWQNHINDPANDQIKEMVTTRLRYLYFYLCSLPEYQLS